MKTLLLTVVSAAALLAITASYSATGPRGSQLVGGLDQARTTNGGEDASGGDLIVSGGSTLAASPSGVAPHATVTVTWSGVSSPSKNDWIGLYRPGDADYLEWIYDSSCTQTAGGTAKSSGWCSFAMNVEPGIYELRLFSDDLFATLPIARSNPVTVTSDVTLVASPPSVLARGEASVTVSWSGVPSPSTGDWIGLYHPGDANSAFIDWIYDSTCTRPARGKAKSSGSCSFAMNVAPGTYELRLFPDDTFIPLASSGTVSVTSNAILVASPSSITAGGAADVTVGWSGVPSPSTHDWIGLYHPGDADTVPINWIYDSSCTQTAGGKAKRYGWCSFAMLQPVAVDPGAYELRLFSNDTFIRLTSSVTVSVTSNATLVASPSSITAGEAANVTVRWSGVTDSSTNDWISPSVRDWIGLYHPGDADSAFIDWIYDSRCTQTAGGAAKSSGSCSFAMPLAFGNYEFRLLANDSFTVLATSNIVTAN